MDESVAATVWIMGSKAWMSWRMVLVWRRAAVLSLTVSVEMPSVLLRVSMTCLPCVAATCRSRFSRSLSHSCRVAIQ